MNDEQLRQEEAQLARERAEYDPTSVTAEMILAGGEDDAEAAEETPAELLTRLHDTLTRYVVFPNTESTDAVTLWIAATHGQEAWEHAPRLVFTSPEKRCGKSRAMDLGAGTCHDPLITVNATAPAVFRSIGDDDPPTLLVDEADSIFGTKRSAENNEDLRALINAGHQRNRPCRRCVGPHQTPTDFPTFAMAMLASIGDLPDTVMDRAVVIRMRRRAPDEQIAPFRTRRDAVPLGALREELSRWIRAHVDELRDAEPQMPVEDRAADTWEPLIAVADLASGDWPKRARAAAARLTTEADEVAAETSLGVRLLADLRTIFAGEHSLYSTSILVRLHQLDEAPWGNLFGYPLDSRGLAKRLRAFGVRSKDVREGGGKNLKGYSSDELHEAWVRYLPLVRDKGDERDMPGQAVADASVVADANATGFPSATGMTRHVAHVADVALVPPDEAAS